MALIDAMVTDLSAARAILRSRRPAPSRWAVLRCYLKLRIKYIVGTRVFRRRLNSERILETRMRAGSYFNLLYLFIEMFVNDEYGFKATSAKPKILDCGANIGMATLYFKSVYPNAEVIAFEPAPDTFSCLKENVGSISGVEVRNQAIAGKAGVLELTLERGRQTSPMASTTSGRVEGDRVAVEAITLSSAIDGPVTFLKIDIEGAETEALEELEASGKIGLVEQMAIEYHHHVTPEDDGFSRLLALLERCGFGYQFRATPESLYVPRAFQDGLVYAYRRHLG